ncbi:DUF4190 domain-containing protein [Streptomyces sp. NPDC004629]|uniref:DUF4190 domain-containing protein n=1 Tax=Streptomyces sp. NPDC004629 TaxID=3364705 RepID=UPI0036BBC843
MAPSVHDQSTVASYPEASTAPPWAGPAGTPPAAPPPNPFAPPRQESPAGAPFAPPAAQPQGAPVPPPPLAPGGPGQVPYGYPGGPAGYGYPAPPAAGPGYYGWSGMQPMPSNGLGTAGLVLGILAAIGFCMWPVAILVGALAVIFGAIGRGRARRGEATNPGQALAGIICGATGIVLALVLLAFFIATTA